MMFKNKLVKGALGFGIGTGISRILGLAREVVFAYLFGASWVMDAFRVAFRIPNLLRDLLAEGTLTPAFLPMFSDYYTREGRESAIRFVSLVFGAMLMITGIITVLGIFFAPFLVKLISFGFTKHPDKFWLTVKLTRIIFPFLIFITISALVMGILNFFNHFFTTGVASGWFDIAIIALGLLFATKLGAVSIAIGALIGGALQFAYQLPLLKKEKYLCLPKFKFNQDVKRVLLLMAPIAIGYGASKINVVVNTLIASFLEHGAISWLEYAFRLMFVPVGVIGVALSNALLPFASRELSLDNREEFKRTMDTSVLYGVLFAVPVSIVLYFLAEPVCKIIYQHGSFAGSDTIATAQALKFYCIGITGLILARIWATGFYALKETKTPMKVSFITVVVNAVCALTLVKVFGFKGIALAFSISNLVNAGILGLLFRRRINSINT